MNIVLTEWSLSSYLDLKHSKVFSDTEYKRTLRPDIELLKLGWPSPCSQFSNPHFWGPATGLDGATIQHGFKMKWHNFGNGKVQLRVAVVILFGKAFLCQGYVKNNAHKDKREMAKLKNRINDISKETYEHRGFL